MENLPEKIPRDRLLLKELLTSLAAIIILAWLALIFSAPLAGPAGAPTPAGTSVKAPWIFVGLQVLLGYLPPLWGGVLLPLSALSFLALLPMEKRLAVPYRVSTLLFLVLLTAVTALTIYGVIH